MSHLIQKIQTIVVGGYITDSVEGVFGSITIGRELMKECDLEEGEVIEVSNYPYGTDSTTAVVLRGEDNGRELIAGGSLSRMFFKGDRVNLMLYTYVTRYNGDPPKYNLKHSIITLSDGDINTPISN